MYLRVLDINLHAFANLLDFCAITRYVHILGNDYQLLNIHLFYGTSNVRFHFLFRDLCMPHTSVLGLLYGFNMK